MGEQADMFSDLLTGIRASVAATYGAGEPAANAEVVARDAALDAIALSKPEVIAIARQTAVRLATENGTVTSTQVLADMRKRGHTFYQHDPRFMGCVFRRGWKRVGYDSTGASHGRPCSVWKLAQS